MRDTSEEPQKAVALGRIYFAGVGIVLIGVGVLAIVYYEAPQRWLAGSIALPGIISLIYAFSRRGDAVAQTARSLLEDLNE